jgi:hypothetical protein
MTKETLNDQIDQKNVDPHATPTLKSAKNMAGYAEDKQIDPKLLKVGELVREAQEEDAEPDYCCTDDELMECQDKKKEALEAQRMTTPGSNK